MRLKICKTCLWWWDLYGTGERKCYRKESPFFHKIPKIGCDKHEEQINARMNLNIGMGFCRTK